MKKAGSKIQNFFYNILFVKVTYNKGTFFKKAPL